MSFAERIANPPRADTEDVSLPDKFTEIRRRLARIEDLLSQTQSNCIIDILGIVHAFPPGKKLLRRISQADMVTLELTRGVVQAGLAAQPTRLLENNIFWREVIGALREGGKTRMARGIEVNQAPRVAWKRFSLHHGQPTLGSTLLTVEVDEKAIENLTSYLTRDEIEALRQYKWLTTDTLSVTKLFSRLSNETLKQPDSVRVYPIPLCQGFSLVSVNFGELKKDRLLTTLMLPPHPSLINARREIEKVLKQSPACLTDKEIHLYSLAAMENFLLAPAELTDAREITYALNQLVKNNPGSNQRIDCLHLGGAGHTRVIAQILTDCLPADSRHLAVAENYDPRFGPYRGDAQSFFREQIPFIQLVGVTKIADGETTINPQRAAEEVRKALEAHPEDFQKRVTVARLLKERCPSPKGIRAYRGLLRDLNKFYTTPPKPLSPQAFF